MEKETRKKLITQNEVRFYIFNIQRMRKLQVMKLGNNHENGKEINKEGCVKRKNTYAIEVKMQRRTSRGIREGIGQKMKKILYEDVFMKYIDLYANKITSTSN